MSYLFRPKKCFRPLTVCEAVSFLSEYGGKAKIIAGGTDLLVEKPSMVDFLVDITSLPLDYIEDDGECLRIGALTTINTIQNSGKLIGPYAVLVETARKFGHKNVRNIATIGGNLCSSVPSADLAPPLMVLDTTMRIAGPKKERSVPIDEFFVSVRNNVLKTDEILLDVQLPPLSPLSGTAFSKIGRTSIDIAIVNVSVRLSLEEDGTCKEARIALGAVAPTSIRAVRAERLLEGRRIDNDLIERAAFIVLEEIKPISDVRSSAEYRRKASFVMVKRCIMKAKERAEEV